MKNLTGYETYLGYNGLNEQILKKDSMAFIRAIAAQNGVDSEALLKFIKDDLEISGIQESKVNEMLGDGIATLSDFFLILPALVIGLLGLAAGTQRLQGYFVNNEYIKLEIDRILKERIKKDPLLIDNQAELVMQIKKELENDPLLQDKLRKARMEGGLRHPDMAKQRYSSKSHLFGSGER